MMTVKGYARASFIPGLLLTLACAFSPDAYAQKQLVLLSHQTVYLRLVPGDEIVYKLKGSDVKVTSYINNLFDTAILAHKTVVPFHRIERLYFKRSSFINKIGKGLFVGGIGYFAIDQFNTIVVQGEKPSLNENVTTASVVMVAAGLPMMLINRRSLKLKKGYRLLTVEPDSPFYKRNLQHMQF